MGKDDSQHKERQSIRIKRDFLLTFYDREHPLQKAVISQLRDISLKGMSFTASRSYPITSNLHIQLRIPYLQETLELEGTVVECTEKIANVVYTLHLRLDPVSSNIEAVLVKVIRDFTPPEALPERRRYLRIKKNFMISYFLTDDPAQKYNISQLKNISLGGMCFVTVEYYRPATKMCVELRTPYFEGVTRLEGRVLASQEKIPDILYETRLAFDYTDAKVEKVIDRIIAQYKQGD